MSEYFEREIGRCLVGLISEFWNCLLLDKKVDNLLYNKIFFPMTSVSYLVSYLFVS